MGLDPCSPRIIDVQKAHLQCFSNSHLQVTVSTEVRNFSAAPCQAMAFFLHAPSAKSLATYLSPKLYRALRFANGFRALELSVVFRAASTSPMPVINFFGVTATGVHPYPIVYSALAIEEKTCTSVWRACEVVVNEGANYKPPVILRIPELKFLLDLSGWLEGRRSRLCVETCGCRRNVRGSPFKRNSRSTFDVSNRYASNSRGRRLVSTGHCRNQCTTACLRT